MKGVYSKKVTGVEHASIGTTLTLQEHMSDDVQEARNPLKARQLKPKLGIYRQCICLDHGHW
jgi:hypothetical protein